MTIILNNYSLFDAVALGCMAVISKNRGILILHPGGENYLTRLPNLSILPKSETPLYRLDKLDTVIADLKSTLIPFPCINS